MQKGTGLNLGLRYVPESTAQGIRRLPEHQQAQIQEIRLRVQQLPRVYDGRTEQPLPGCEPLRQAQLQACLKTACADSLYSFQRELSQGFVTVEGGNRIGFCGNGVIRDGEVETIRYVSSLNIRIAKQVLGCGQALYEKLFAQGRQSVLLLVLSRQRQDHHASGFMPTAWQQVPGQRGGRAWRIGCMPTGDSHS